jgi:hypothetical protein
MSVSRGMGSGGETRRGARNDRESGLLRSTEKRMEIHRAAVAFFSAGSGPEDRAEEIYHRLWLDQSPSEIEARWLSGIELSLRGAVEEPEGPHAFF